MSIMVAFAAIIVLYRYIIVGGLATPYILSTVSFASGFAMLLTLHVAFHLPVFFFFSSRRRHTRSLCDWSSDVCSSDLFPSEPSGSEWPARDPWDQPRQEFHIQEIVWWSEAETVDSARLGGKPQDRHSGRSEERRVGKECRSRWCREHKRREANGAKCRT